MKYYTKKPKYHYKINNKRSKFPYGLLIIVLLIMVFNGVFYMFSKRILASVLSVGEVKMKSEAVRIINEESVKVFSEDFNYEDIINIEKDSEGNIILADEVSPDTCRLWDVDTNEKLDKDRFRRDLGNVEETYAEVLKRVKND